MAHLASVYSNVWERFFKLLILIVARVYKKSPDDQKLAKISFQIDGWK